jgi:membrane-associated phospholipid phosphatase
MKEDDRQRAVKAMEESKDDELSKDGSNEAATTTPNHRFSQLVRSLGTKHALIWVLPLLYIIIILIAYFRYGIILNASLGIFAIIAIPIAAYLSRSREFLRNSILIITLLLSYEALQNVIASITNTSNAIALDTFDRAMFGFNFTAAVQNTFYSSIMTLITTAFYSLHIFLVIIAMIIFWFANKKIYRGYTYSLILTSYLALATFAIFPTDPPWISGVAKNLVLGGYKMLPGAINILMQELLSVSNKLAAFPSLHAAYATLFAVYTIKLNPKLGLVSVPILFGVLFSTIYLGQHYVLDLIGGIVYSLIAFFIVERLIATNKKGSNVK